MKKNMKKNIKKNNDQKENDTFISLYGIRHEEVSNHWLVEVIEFKHWVTDEYNYAVRLTSKLRGQKSTFLKEELEDTNNHKKIERKLGKIGVIKSSYLKVMSNSVNEALCKEKEKIINLEDEEEVLLHNTMVRDITISSYINRIVNHINSNPELFPTYTSDKYIHNKSEGVILDNYNKNKYGFYPVAFRSGYFRDLVSMGSSNKYREELLDILVEIGAIQGKIDHRELEDAEENIQGNTRNEEVFINYYGETTIKSSLEKRRLDKRIPMTSKKQEANVFILNLNLKGGH